MGRPVTKQHSLTVNIPQLACNQILISEFNFTAELKQKTSKNTKPMPADKALIVKAFLEYTDWHLHDAPQLIAVTYVQFMLQWRVE